MDTPYVFKRCTKCGRWLVASSLNFNKAKKGKFGLRAQCKECEKKYKKEYDETNKYAKAEYNKKYYEQNKEAIAKYKKRWDEENKEAVAEYCKKRYEENKEAIVERQKKYRNTPQGQVVLFNGRNKRRAKEQNQGSGIAEEQWLEMMNFFNWKCAYSGKKLTKKTRSIDHIEPLNKGGENEIWNCIPMNRSLNSSKQDKDMLEWYTKQPFYSYERLLKISEWQEYAKNNFFNK